MSVGYFGNIVFSVSRNKIHSFNNFKRTRTAEWKEHIRYGQKATSQFTSLGLETITFDIHLDKNLGIDPRKMIDKWGKLLENGHHDILVIGNEQIGNYEWKIESISESWNTLLNKGELITADLTITMSEYVDIDSIQKNEKKSEIKTFPKTPQKNSANGLVVGSKYQVKTMLIGYYTSMEAKNQTAVNRTGKVYPGSYFIFNIANGVINVTKVKGSPGSWINPKKNK